MLDGVNSGDFEGHSDPFRRPIQRLPKVICVSLPFNFWPTLYIVNDDQVKVLADLYVLIDEN